MTNLPDQIDAATATSKPPQYHPPVMVDYGSARNLTRTGNSSLVPDGGFVDDGIDPDGGSGRTSN